MKKLLQVDVSSTLNQLQNWGMDYITCVNNKC